MDQVVIIEKKYHDFYIQLFPRNDVNIKGLSREDIQKIKNEVYPFYYLERRNCEQVFIKIAGYTPILSLITVGRR